MNSTRTSGVLMHVTSLPGRRLGREAYRFVDWLAAAGQSWWQVLPLVPPDRYGSPYKARSAFAAWPGLLSAPRARVTAAERLEFRERESYWVEDWMRFGGGTAALDDQVRFDREWGALRAYAAERGIRLFGDVAIYVAPGSADHRAHPGMFQTGCVAGAPPDAFSALGQLWGNPLYDWSAVRKDGYRWWVERVRRTLELFDAARLDHFRGFVAYWAVPQEDDDARRGRWRRGPGRALFEALDSALAPPQPGTHRLDGRYSSHSVQTSEASEREESERAATERAASERAATERAATERSPRSPSALPLVAEDLGVITPAVERLRDELGIPGMLVLQFGFDPRDPRSPHRFENHVENRVVYTGTHDHDTARGWFDSLDPGARKHVERELDTALGPERLEEPHWALIQLAFASPARTAIVQAQDILGLGSKARTNDPSRRGGNWRWVMEPGVLTGDLAKRLRAVTEQSGRATPAG